ncbi:hypothetical protein TBLA_0C05520 [Henningerozyma blattae CBS 6284]|uniref:Pro-apoptotic serine protease NMA111 n=1 Tax=Henningerozyma blattae (strain ATCC 34711 / CBS 6284 / DSM 70876 / NBRC 10599 / NRRL Y-10934 / UCD 77-7) TaxID=1071380 RepID=I2H1U8_HENB6|nr:hypothetical protein TBLA_0C05520 [Tetrapisispora blattae CBS 6284]CCH60350.1 hypothetical protein TBLA_0C05520 [Tetrapisispora blattae CBS 6284]
MTNNLSNKRSISNILNPEDAQSVTKKQNGLKTNQVDSMVNGISGDDEFMDDIEDSCVVVEYLNENMPISENNENYIKWQNTISNVVKSVVSIHFSQVTPFDSESALVSEATGFVVDAKLGIILTNRHVVGPGPFVGYAVFDNHEECDVIPIYRDPVHDFGFLKFDPQQIKYMDIQALKLKPTLAKVGSEIRVVGNDAGEKLSILAGFISRLDRNAPDYGELTYNDFNTEYIQAAASASGGSSGSPVVNIDGYAVALQAGGSTEASTDFFLPLDRILRALKCVQNKQAITRGSIQVQWLLKPYDECKRLGLTPERESEARRLFPGKIGLLVAETILKKGPADEKIKEGDILISINNTHISSFIEVDDIFDSNVGNTLEIVLQRGGKDHTINCKVGDLHDITPAKYVEVCGATFNELSYQMARFYGIKAEGVFLSSPSTSFNFDNNDRLGWIIDTVDNRNTPNIATFIEVMKTIPDKQRITIKYHHLTDQHTQHVKSICVDRHWCSEFRLYERNDETGIWDYTNIADPIPPEPLKPHSAKFIGIALDNSDISKLSHSLCMVTTTSSIPLDSVSAETLTTSGLIVDAEHGFVLASRRVIPHDCLDIYVTFADSVIIPANIEFLHPTQNYAILKYDTSLIKADIITPKLSTKRMCRGDKPHFIGFTHNNRLVTSPTTVTDISSVSIPSNLIPRYRATNLEAISIDCNVSTKCNSGILTDSDGTIRALWLSFLGERQENKEKVYLMGLDIVDCIEIIELLKKDIKPKVSIVDAEFGSISILNARIRGVPEEWISRMEKQSNNRLQFITVTRISFSTNKINLKTGDVILAVNDKLVTELSQMNGVVRDKLNLTSLPPLCFKVVRDGKVIDLNIETVEVTDTNHIGIFSGCILQAPHHAVRQSMINIPSEVYCTFRGESSPALQYGIQTTNFITHVNDIETPNLEIFLDVVRKIPNNSYCNVRLMTFDNVPFAISLKTNYHYFPTAELKKDLNSGKWTVHEITKTNEKNKPT